MHNYLPARHWRDENLNLEENELEGRRDYSGRQGGLQVVVRAVSGDYVLSTCVDQFRWDVINSCWLPFLQWLYCSLHFSAKDKAVVQCVCLGTIQYWWVSVGLVKGEGGMGRRRLRVGAATNICLCSYFVCWFPNSLMDCRRGNTIVMSFFIRILIFYSRLFITRSNFQFIHECSCVFSSLFTSESQNNLVGMKKISIELSAFPDPCYCDRQHQVRQENCWQVLRKKHISREREKFLRLLFPLLLLQQLF